jgi:hypothetical protein
MVTLITGSSDNSTKYRVHKEFACHSSPVFRAAFNSNFIEGQTQTYRLEDTRERTVSLLVQWIYNNDTYVTDDDVGYVDLVALWILADKLCMPQLQNKVIDKLSKRTPKSGSQRAMIASLEMIYNQTESKSQLQKFAVEICALHVTPDDIRETPELFPVEFLVDYADRLYRHFHTALAKRAFKASAYHVSVGKKSKPPKQRVVLIRVPNT